MSLINEDLVFCIINLQIQFPTISYDVQSDLQMDYIQLLIFPITPPMN